MSYTKGQVVPVPFVVIDIGTGLPITSADTSLYGDYALDNSSIYTICSGSFNERLSPTSAHIGSFFYNPLSAEMNGEVIDFRFFSLSANYQISPIYISTISISTGSSSNVVVLSASQPFYAPLTSGDTRLNNLDATISSRLATSAYGSSTNVVVLSANQPFYAPLQSSAYDSLAGAGFNTGTDSLHQIRTRVDQVLVATGTPILVSPTSAIRIVGSDQGGTVADLISHDDVSFATGEDGSLGLEVRVITSASITTENPSLVRVTGYYDGGLAHQINVNIYNYSLSAYSQVGTMLTRSTAFDYVFPLTHDNQDLLTGEMKLQFLHNVATYSSAHNLYLDWISFEKVETNSQIASDLAAIRAKTDLLNFNLTNVNANSNNFQQICDAVNNLIPTSGGGTIYDVVREIEGVQYTALNLSIDTIHSVDIPNLKNAVFTRLATWAYTSAASFNSQDICNAVNLLIPTSAGTSGSLNYTVNHLNVSALGGGLNAQQVCDAVNLLIPTSADNSLYNRIVDIDDTQLPAVIYGISALPDTTDIASVILLNPTQPIYTDVNGLVNTSTSASGITPSTIVGGLPFDDAMAQLLAYNGNTAEFDSTSGTYNYLDVSGVNIVFKNKKTALGREKL